MKKIAFVLQDLQIGGVQSVICNLSRHMSSLGHEVHIILLSAKSDFDNLKPVKVHSLAKSKKIIRFSKLNHLFQYFLLKNKIELLEAQKPFDLIISSQFSADRICTKIDHENLWLRVNTNFYNTAHSCLTQRKLEAHRQCYRDRNIFCNSKGIAEDLSRELRARAPIKTIYNPVDRENITVLIKNSEQQLPSQSYIVYAGRNEFRQKRLDLLLKAYAKLHTEFLLVMLTQASDQLTAFIQELGLRDRVLVVGYQKNPFPWIHKAKCLVLSSDYEGFPNVLVDALASETIPVATNCPSGPSEILTGKLKQFLAPVGDVDALSEKIELALTQPIPITDDMVRPFDISFIAQQYLSLGEQCTV